MRKTVPMGATSAQDLKPEFNSSSRRRHAAGQEVGRLSEMAAIANRSSAVQAQLKLAEELQRSPSVQAQRVLSENATQRHTGISVNDDPRLEDEANRMGASEMQMTRSAEGQRDRLAQVAYTHAEGCACPGCSANPQQSVLAQLKATAASGQVAQLRCSECGKEKGHLSGCSRNKHNRGVERQEEQKENKESSSWGNMQAYRPGWIKKNGITEDLVKEFCREMGRKIRGHASGDSSQGEQDNTKEDLTAYKSWHTTKYGWK